LTHSPYCVLGNLTIDDLVFADGSTNWGVPGGNAVYAGLGMALWDERPIIVAPVGPEYPVEKLGGRLDLSHCRPLDRTLRDWGLYEEDGTRNFVFRSKTRDWREFSPVVSDLDSVEVTYAHIAPLPADLQPAIAKAMRDRGAKLISVDLDDRELVALEPRERPRWREFLGSIDLFLPSRQDVATLFPGVAMPDALRRLRELVPDLSVIAIKLSADGVIVHAAGAAEYFKIPSIAETVVDATGAGDTFCGGAILGYARTGSALEAALFGSVSASFAVAATGLGALVVADAEVAAARLRQVRARAESHVL
jgi:sugar/nucleoside kinase (ribokinase family)